MFLPFVPVDGVEYFLGRKGMFLCFHVFTNCAWGHGLEHTRPIGQSAHFIFPIQVYFCRIVFFIAVLDTSKSTDQFCHFRLFIVLTFLVGQEP